MRGEGGDARAARRHRRRREGVTAPKRKRRQPDLPRAVALNKDFHFAVYEASGMPDLVEIIGGLWLKIGPIINLDLRENPERLETGGAVRFHAQATDAIARRDGAAARAAIAGDISGTAAFLLAKGGLAEG